MELNSLTKENVLILLKFNSLFSEYTYNNKLFILKFRLKLSKMIEMCWLKMIVFSTIVCIKIIHFDTFELNNKML